MSGPVTTVAVQPGVTLTVVVTETAPNAVAVTENLGATATSSSTETVTVEELAIRGLQGPPGPQGPSGVSALNPFVWHQDVPEATWMVVHNLNTYPLLTIVDSAGEMVFGSIAYLNPNTVQISFGAPFSGLAYLL